jgi:hypothetical protein
MSPKTTVTGGWDTTTLILHAARLASQHSTDEGFTLEDIIATVDQLMDREGIEFTGTTQTDTPYRTRGERVVRGRFGDLRRSGFFSLRPPVQLDNVYPLTVEVEGKLDGEMRSRPRFDSLLLYRLSVFLTENNRRCRLEKVAQHLKVEPDHLLSFLKNMSGCHIQYDGVELVLDPVVTVFRPPAERLANGHTRKLSVRTLLGHQVDMHVPDSLLEDEVHALETVARRGRVTELELKKCLKLRRVTDLMEALLQKLLQSNFRALDIQDAGPLGYLYVFDRHLVNGHGHA